MEWRHNVRVALTYSRHLANAIATPDYTTGVPVSSLSPPTSPSVSVYVCLCARVYLCMLHGMTRLSTLDRSSRAGCRSFNLKPQPSMIALCSSLFHDLLSRSYLYHCVWSVITAHNLTPEKPDNNYSPDPLIPTSCLRNNIQLITGSSPCCGCL